MLTMSDSKTINADAAITKEERNTKPQRRCVLSVIRFCIACVPCVLVIVFACVPAFHFQANSEELLCARQNHSTVSTETVICKISNGNKRLGRCWIVTTPIGYRHPIFTWPDWNMMVEYDASVFNPGDALSRSDEYYSIERGGAFPCWIHTQASDTVIREPTKTNPERDVAGYLVLASLVFIISVIIWFFWLRHCGNFE